MLDTTAVISNADHHHVIAAKAVGQVWMYLPVEARASASFDEARFDHNMSAIRREFDRIGQQIEQHLLFEILVHISHLL